MSALNSDDAQQTLQGILLKPSVPGDLRRESCAPPRSFKSGALILLEWLSTLSVGDATGELDSRRPAHKPEEFCNSLDDPRPGSIKGLVILEILHTF